MRRQYLRGKIAKKNQLRASFIDTKETPCDMFYSHDGGCNTDLRMLHYHLSSPKFTWEGASKPSLPSFLYELIDRGYDITTFEMSIQKLDTSDLYKVNLNQRMKKILS